MEDKHCTTYKAEYKRHTFGICTHVPYKDGLPKGKPYVHYSVDGRVFKTKQKFYEFCSTLIWFLYDESKRNYGWGHRVFAVYWCHASRTSACYRTQSVRNIEKRTYLLARIWWILPYFPEQYQETTNRGFALETDGNGEWMITDHQLMQFRYVHELQHILRLCKMSDIADNFKV